MAKWNRRLLQTVLPRSLRHSIYRERLALPSSWPSSLVFKIAETQTELEQAFSLLHDSYVAAGFMDPSKSGLRVTPHHLLPTTTTLVALSKGRVVATVALVRDSVLGLPMDSIFELSHFRENGERIAEVSSLAIAPEFRVGGGPFLHSFIRFLWRYSLFYHGTNRFLIAVNPSMRELYESIYLFQPATEAYEVEHYDYVKGAPAIGLETSLDDSLRRFKQVYGDKTDERNLYRFMAMNPLDHERYPKRKFYTVNDSVWTPETLRYFLVRYEELESLLSKKVLVQLQDAYDRRGIQSVVEGLLGREGRIPTGSLRGYRHDVRCPIRIVVRNEFGQEAYGRELVVNDVSRDGMRIFMGRQHDRSLPIELFASMSATVTLAPGVFSNLRIIPIWKSQFGHVGVQIEQSDSAWRRFIAELEETNDMRAIRKVA